MKVTLVAPADLADDLVAEGLAQRRPALRGPLDDAVHILVEGVDWGASLVTVTAALAAGPRLAKRLAADLRRRSTREVTIEVRGPGVTRKIVVRPESTDAELTERVAAALRECADERPPGLPDG